MDQDLRALERRWLASRDDASLEGWASQAERMGQVAVRAFRASLEAADAWDALGRFFWRRALVRLDALEVYQCEPNGVGLERGDVLEWTSGAGKSKKRWRVIEATGGGPRDSRAYVPEVIGSRTFEEEDGPVLPGGRVRVVPEHDPLLSERRGNRWSQWLGRLVEPFDPRKARLLLAEKPNVSARRLQCREWVRSILSRTWCLGDSEERTRELFGLLMSRRSFGYETLAFWCEVRDRTGWTPLREKGREVEDALDGAPEREPEPEMPLFTRRAR